MLLRADRYLDVRMFNRGVRSGTTAAGPLSLEYRRGAITPRETGRETFPLEARPSAEPAAAEPK